MTSILVVEDDPTVRQLICEVLVSEGFEVDAAADGRQALDRVAERRPALLVLDLTLPLMSGPDLIAALRRQDGPPPPILVISGAGDAPRKARELGAFAYLQKPFDIDMLLDLVMRQVPSRQA